MINKNSNHEPIITRETYDRCQRILEENNNCACRRRKHDFLLRGYTFCQVCDQRFTAGIVKKKDKSYYYCSSRIKTKCNQPYVPVDDLEELVALRFEKIRFSQDLIDKVVVKVQALYEQQRDSVKDEKGKLQNSKNNLERKREVAEEKLINGVLNDAAFSRVVSKIDEQIGQIEELEYQLKQRRKIKIDVIRDVLQLVTNIGPTYREAKPALKRLYLGLFWSKFLIENREIVDAQKSPILEALESIGSVDFGDDDHISPIQKEDLDQVQISSVLGDVVEDVRTVFEQLQDETIYIPVLNSVDATMKL